MMQGLDNPRSAPRLQLFFYVTCVAAQSHNAMEVYTNPKDFISAQLVSTRDISAGPWNDWFTGERSCNDLLQ